jgi:hypothetical protein
MTRSTRGLEIVDGRFSLFGMTVEQFDDYTLCFSSADEPLLTLADPTPISQQLIDYIDLLRREGYNLGQLCICLGEYAALELLFNGALENAQPTTQDAAGTILLRQILLGGYILDIRVMRGMQAFAISM